MLGTKDLKRQVGEFKSQLSVKARIRPVYRLYDAAGAILRVVDLRGQRVTVDDKTDVVFEMPEKAFLALAERKRYCLLHGGRGGSKSWSIAQYVIGLLIEQSGVCLCLREFQSSIRQSVHSLLKTIIERDAKLRDFFEILVEEIRGENGALFAFRGAREANVSSLQSFENIRFCWIEEGQVLRRVTFQTIAPTIRVQGSRIFVSMNPVHSEDFLYAGVISQPELNPDWTICQILYSDNPFLSETLRGDAEAMRRNRFDEFSHIYGGNLRLFSDTQILKYTVLPETFDLSTLIEERVKVESRRPGASIEAKRKAREEAQNAAYAGYKLGIDYGWTDPSILTIAYLNPIERAIYLLDEIWEEQLPIRDFARMINRKLLEWDLQGYPILADSASPQISAELRYHGINVRSCQKNKILDDIDHLKNWALRVHSRCNHAISELSLYSWMVNSNGDALPRPAAGSDHVADALRYSLGDEIDIRRNIEITKSKIQIGRLG